MYIESSRLRRFCPFVDIRYLYYICYLADLCSLLCLFKFYLQNRALLDTLQKLRSTRGSGHIFNMLAIGHTKHPNEQRISSWPFAAKKVRGANRQRQDFVFIRPPGISHGAFEIRMDNVWFCKILLLFQVGSKPDLGLKRHSCASVLEEYAGPRRPVESLILLIPFIVLIVLIIR